MYESYVVSELGNILAGFGVFMLLMVIAYFFYQLTRTLKSSTDREELLDLAEMSGIRTVCKNIGLNPEKEEAMKNKSFQKVIQKEMIREFFEDKANEVQNGKESKR